MNFRFSTFILCFLFFTNLASAMTLEEALRTLKELGDKNLNHIEVIEEQLTEPDKERFRDLLEQGRETNLSDVSLAEEALRQLQGERSGFMARLEEALVEKRVCIFGYRKPAAESDVDIKFEFYRNEKGRLYVITSIGYVYDRFAPAQYEVRAHGPAVFVLNPENGFLEFKITALAGWPVFTLRIKEGQDTLYILERGFPSQSFVLRRLNLPPAGTIVPEGGIEAKDLESERPLLLRESITDLKRLLSQADLELESTRLSRRWAAVVAQRETFFRNFAEKYVGLTAAERFRLTGSDFESLTRASGWNRYLTQLMLSEDLLAALRRLRGDRVKVDIVFNILSAYLKRP